MSKATVGKRLLGGFFLFLSLLASFMTLIALAVGDITVPLFFCIVIGCLLSGIGLLRLRKWGTYSAIVTAVLILLTLFTFIYKSMSYVGVNAPKFSPDGRNLILSIGAGRDSGIYKIRLSDRSFQRVTFPSTKANEMNPSYSPDGSKVVFSRYQENDHYTHLFLMDADGENLIQLTKGNYFDLYPKFSPNGKKVYFIREDEAEGEVHNGMKFYKDAIYFVSLDSLESQKVTSHQFDCDRGISIS